MNPKIRKLIIAALAVLTLAGVVFTTNIKPASEQSATGNPATQEANLGQSDPEENENLEEKITPDESDARADGADEEADEDEKNAAASSSTTGQSGSAGSSSGSTGQGSSSGSGSAQGNSSSSSAGQSSSSGSGSGQSSSGSDNSSKQKTISCTITIDCSLLTDEAVLQGTGNENKQRYVPSNGKIASGKSVKVKKGSSVYDVLKSFCKAQNIQMEASYTPGLETYYVEGINHLYEFDGGEGSGWVYFVNGQSPNYGAFDVEVKEGDSIVWMYTLDYGNDVTP